MNNLRRVVRLSGLILPCYILVMLSISAVIYDNPHLIFPGQVGAEIINPFDNDGNTSNYTEVFDQFEGFVMIASTVASGNHDLHLYAFPGRRAQVYRDFSIYIFTNEPCLYEIRIDDQVYQRGYSEWKTIVKASSPYATLNVEVKLVDEENASLPVFYFKDVTLLDSPWDAQQDDGDGLPVVEEWVRFTQGEFTVFVLRSIAIQLAFAFLGVVAGTAMAAMRADLQGIRQVM